MSASNTCDAWVAQDKGKLLHDEIEKKLDGLKYGDLYPEVRQRVRAFRRYCRLYKPSHWAVDDADYLDEAYRFLYTPVDPDFVVRSAELENIDPMRYLDLMLGEES